LQLKQQALEAFRETVAVFSEHVEISEKCQKLAPPHELLRYLSFDILIPIIIICLLMTTIIIILIFVSRSYCHAVSWHDIIVSLSVCDAVIYIEKWNFNVSSTNPADT